MNTENTENYPKDTKAGKASRGALQVAGGVPGIGGVFSAIAGFTIFYYI